MLTLPLLLAAATAGIAGGVHCIGMCGGLSLMLGQMTAPKRKVIHLQAVAVGTAETPASASASTPVKQPTTASRFALHGGRIATYMLAGALLGGLGNAGIMTRPHPLLQQVLFIVGNLLLILLGLRVLGVRWPAWKGWVRLAGWQQRFFGVMTASGARSPFLTGMAWGCLPCGLLYTVAPLALLSGGVLSGAALMAVFGLCALPHLLAGQGIIRLLARGGIPRLIRYAGSLLLIAIGIAGIWYSDMKQMPDFLCVLPTP